MKQLQWYPFQCALPHDGGVTRAQSCKKDQLCVGVSGFPVAAMLKRRDVILGSRMFAQVWRRVGLATDWTRNHYLLWVFILRWRRNFLRQWRRYPCWFWNRSGHAGCAAVRHDINFATRPIIGWRPFSALQTPIRTILGLLQEHTKQRWYTNLELICHLLQGVTAEIQTVPKTYFGALGTYFRSLARTLRDVSISPLLLAR